MMGDGHGPAEGSIEASLTVLAEMQQQGLVKHIGLSNVTPTQVAEARKIAEIVCVQNEYNIAHRADDAMIEALARDGIAYVPGSFRSGALRRCNLPRFPMLLRAWVQHQCRWRWRGCYNVHRIFC